MSDADPGRGGEEMQEILDHCRTLVSGLSGREMPCNSPGASFPLGTSGGPHYPEACAVWLYKAACTYYLGDCYEMAAVHAREALRADPAMAQSGELLRKIYRALGHAGLLPPSQVDHAQTAEYRRSMYDGGGRFRAYIGPVEPYQTERRGVGLRATGDVRAGTLLIAEAHVCRLGTGPEGDTRMELPMRAQHVLSALLPARGAANPREYYKETFDLNATDGTYVKDGMFHADELRVYPTIALINHACLPNTLVVGAERGAAVVVVRDIAAGEEVTAAYLPPMTTREYRRVALHEGWAFWCQCEQCVAEAETAAAAAAVAPRTLPAHEAPADNGTEGCETARERLAVLTLEMANRPGPARLQAISERAWRLRGWFQRHIGPKHIYWGRWLTALIMHYRHVGSIDGEMRAVAWTILQPFEERYTERVCVETLGHVYVVLSLCGDQRAEVRLLRAACGSTALRTTMYGRRYPDLKTLQDMR
jgi:hypothetical protein